MHYNNIPTGEFYDIAIDASNYTIYGGTQDDATVYGPAKELNTNLGTEYFPNPYTGYQMHTQADISTSKENLGFKVEFTLEEGIKASSYTIISEYKRLLDVFLDEKSKDLILYLSSEAFYSAQIKLERLVSLLNASAP